MWLGLTTAHFVINFILKIQDFWTLKICLLKCALHLIIRDYHFEKIQSKNNLTISSSSGSSSPTIWPPSLVIRLDPVCLPWARRLSFELWLFLDALILNLVLDLLLLFELDLLLRKSSSSLLRSSSFPLTVFTCVRTWRDSLEVSGFIRTLFILLRLDFLVGVVSVDDGVAGRLWSCLTSTLRSGNNTADESVAVLFLSLDMEAAEAGSMSSCMASSFFFVLFCSSPGPEYFAHESNPGNVLETLMAPPSVAVVSHVADKCFAFNSQLASLISIAGSTSLGLVVSGRAFIALGLADFLDLSSNSWLLCIACSLLRLVD